MRHLDLAALAVFIPPPQVQAILLSFTATRRPIRRPKGPSA